MGLFDDLLTPNYIDISIPEFRDCTDAVNLYGDSMSPLYKSGQIIILKQWSENFIDFDIEINDISALFIVKGAISKNTL